MRRLPFFPALEGLRGVAVLAVMLFHAGVPGAGGGFLGVSTFFTLSGFLITRLLTGEREQMGRIRLRAFWGRRIRRLMPAALLGLAAIALLGATLGDYSQQERLRADGLAAMLYVANWWLIQSGAAYADLMGSPSFIQHFWSLAIEEQYYGVFPVIAAALLARGGRRSLAVVLGLGTLASWAWMAELGGSAATTARIYYGTDTRCGELLVGGLLALLLSGRSLSRQLEWLLALLGGLGLIVSACLWTVATVESPWLYQGGLALYALSSCALLAGCVAPVGPVRRLLALPPLRFVGRVSYGAYIYHWPIFLVVDDRTGLPALAVFGLRVALTFAAAAASYRWLETPILSGRMLAGWRMAVAVPGTFAAVALAFQLASSQPASFQPASFRPAASQTASSQPTQPSFTLPELPRRSAALLAGAPRIAVLGDSVAKDIGDGLEFWSARTGAARVLNLAIRGCGLATGAWPDGGNRRQRICDRWRKRARRRLETFVPQIIVVLGAASLGEREKPEWGVPRALGDPRFDAWLVSEFDATVRFFEDFDAPFVWLTTPCLGPPRKGRQPGIYDPARVEHLNEEILAAVASSNPGVTEIDLYRAVCPRGQYQRRLFGIDPFRRDRIHFSKRGQRWLGEWLGPQVVHLYEAARSH